MQIQQCVNIPGLLLGLDIGQRSIASLERFKIDQRPLQIKIQPGAVLSGRGFGPQLSSDLSDFFGGAGLGSQVEPRLRLDDE